MIKSSLGCDGGEGRKDGQLWLGGARGEWRGRGIHDNTSLISESGPPGSMMTEDLCPSIGELASRGPRRSGEPSRNDGGKKCHPQVTGRPRI